VAVLVSISMLWIVGKGESVRRGLVPAILTGLTIGFSCLLLGLVRAPVALFGVLAGLLSMLLLYMYHRTVEKPVEASEPYSRRATISALSPWIIIIALALVISVPSTASWLKGLDGPAVWIFNQPVDFDAFSQVYTWIFLATLLSIPILRPTKQQLSKALVLWVRRIWQPFIAYSFFFGVAYVMAWSAMDLSSGKLVQTSQFASLNMNNVVGLTLAAVFGSLFVLVAPWLGFFGAVVGGSEASSNVLFFPIQHRAIEGIGLTGSGENSSAFMTIYGSHANGGGIASAITPSKINNGAATIGADAKMESEIMKSHFPIVMMIMVVVSSMTALFVMLGV